MVGGLELVSVGLNHRTAPVSLRERLVYGPDRLPEALRQLCEGSNRESMILSTCNRVEVYAVVPEQEGSEGISRFLALSNGIRLGSLDGHLYHHQGPQAVGHLFRVAASLDSQVVGEPQILGQVKEAFTLAREHGAAGRLMQPLMRRTLSVAKRVRTETAIGAGSVSLGSAAVDLATQLFGSLHDRRCLLLGVGEMGRLVCRSMLSHGVIELLLANRTFERALEVAQQFGATAVPWDHLGRYLGAVDVAVVCTGAQHHQITRAMMVPIMRARRYRPLFLVDLSVPRNIAPDVHELEGAYVFNVDDLSGVAQRGVEARAREATRAEELIKSEALRCYQALGAISAGPVIASITRHAEQSRLQELERSEATLEQLSPEHRRIVEAMTRSMFKRFLHNGLGRAREFGRQGDEEALRLLHETFGSDEEEDP